MDIESLQCDIDQATKLNPEHISVYSLTIEDKTVFGNWQKKGKFSQVSDHGSAQQFELIITELEKKGFEQYEVSNFCRDGHYAVHNSSYWKNVQYLGIGPGAHSYNGTCRQYNVAHNHKYLKSLNQGHVPFQREDLTQKSRANEFLMTSLRTKWGCDLNALHDRYGYDILKESPAILRRWISGNYMKIDENTLYLTKKGVLVADEIIADLFLI